MKTSAIKWFLTIAGFTGFAASGASMGLSANIDANQTAGHKINKSELMRGVNFSLSSLTNLDDIRSGGSIKFDLWLALGKNYKGININETQMDFYYGGSTKNPKINFVGTDKYESILYFTVRLHSLKKQFADTTLTFDYRPNLYSFAAEYNGYKDATIWRSKKSSAYKTIGDLLEDFNTYLKTDFVINSFNKQWNEMGLKTDGLSNSEKNNVLQFNKQIINYVNNLEAQPDFDNFDFKILDSIPEYLKFNLFKNFDSSLRMGYSEYYTFTSSSFSNIDEKIVLSSVNANYKELKLQDFKQTIIGTFLSDVLIETNGNAHLDENRLNVQFKKSYKDEEPVYNWDTKIKDIDTNYLWIEFSMNNDGNPFVILKNAPGFHIYVNK